MKQFLAEIFVWWHGQTWGTRLYLWRFFRYVGSDEFGNRYFEAKAGDKRWVVYNGPAEPSTIPPGWHGWMHHRTDTPPSSETYAARAWEKPHLQNLTGTPLAYRPDGSLLTKGQRPRVTGDYDAWSPE
ncbi:NADH:ubiquinone oxidoreductase subunit NDUFA12 [Arsenicitalea aurantiaca]|uniref:NADH:ubiquinone oxidoreductase subunit NDUFA12 n=1 Tax=Arsenicitalea aurantiaca TaxID=1783274 RepID=A0A433XFC1_9HYPH|nr:NADH:ubiquinone oxidoreductase subunit NDUFA12 [Arsenicitalea aurantiaca]RUT32801.1 NADH:ubiquinone oxidoreductase subunit NDUFA12 [Arsenicitalea aurantiaca]